MAGTKRSCCNRFCCFSSSASDEEGQDHPASAGPRSSPSAIVNTTETLPGPPNRSEAPIPGSSNVVVPSKDEDEDGQDHPASAGPRSSPSAIDNTTETLPGPPKHSEAPIPGSSNVVTARKDEDGQDHPASAGPRSSPSAIDNTTETLPGPPKRSEAPIPGSSDVVTPRKDEIEQHVDPNPDVSRTHQCAKAPLSKSQNIPRKSGGEEVNAHPNVSGATQCDEPSSSGSSNLPVKSEGEHVDVNPTVSEAPSSSSSTGVTKSDVIRRIKHIDQADGKEVVDQLVDHISELLKLREEEMLEEKNPSNRGNFPWPKGLNKLKDILSIGPELNNLTESLEKGLDFASKLQDVISGHATTILKAIGQASVVTSGLLVVAYTLETFNDLSDNKDGCWDLIKEMSELALVVKKLNESPKGTFNVIEKATKLVVEGAITCCTQFSHSGWRSFLLASKDKADLSGITQQLQKMYSEISVDISIRNLGAIEGVLASNDNQAKRNSANFELVLASNDYRAKRNSANFGRVLASNDDQAKRNSANFEHVFGALESMRNPPLSRIYPDYAVGIDQSIEDVLSLLDCESAQRAVTVILHGFGGMGKTTLADAVFSRVRGYRYSHVQLFKNIDSKPNITKLQKKILKDLMGPEVPVPEITKYQDGQGQLEEKLEKMEAFIYIDNVLEGAKLKDLLPEDMSRAKKVRLLLTARNEEVKNACPRPCTNPKIYPMQEIQRQAALLILKREIKDGINESQFNDIIDTCGGIPLMLKLAASFVGRATDKQEAYSKLVLQKNKLPSNFGATHCAFAYEALPDDCIEPFLDICSYFKGWDWEAVEDIVGKDELKMLESRALVTRATNGSNDIASVHDVILKLAGQKSNGKEVRKTFTSARELEKFLEEEGAKGIKGIWLSDNKNALEISAATLDLMSKLLRVLRLGDLVNVEGECRNTFKELLYFEANVRQLPFPNVSKLEKLRYLRYQPNDELKLSKMPSSLRHMELNGKSLSNAFKIYSSDLQKLEHLRILRLLEFSMLKSLPIKGDQLKGLHELSLSKCRSITKLPDSISMLRSLRILKMDGCSSLTELPVDFGSLSSLRELHLHGCEYLEELPGTAEKLSSLTLLDLSACTRLLNLPPRVENFTRLVELNLSDCHTLKSIPEGIGNLTGLVELNLSRCGTLKSIPEGIRNLTGLTELNLSYCNKLKSIPKGIGELKLLRALGAIWCETLTELPDGLCNLSFITHLSFQRCERLKKLPDRFGQLASLKAVYFTGCTSLQKLPENFGQLKNLEVLDLRECHNLRELCNDFHCLSSLQNLDLRKCWYLKKLPLDFHCLTSLQRLDLSDCKMLEGKSMDHAVKMNGLQVVHIKESKQLVDRWAEIQRDAVGSWSFTVISGQDLSISRVEKENRKNSLLVELDGLLTNRRGEQFHLSPLPPNTLILVLWDLQPPYILDWRDFIEEMIDETQIKMIYIGPDFDKFSTKVKDNIFVVDVPTTRAAQMHEIVHLSLDLAPDPLINKCLQIDTKMQAGGEYRPCWRLLTPHEMEEFVVSNCKRYLRLKQLQAETDEESSNIELLTELFASQGDETTPVFQKNESSVQQDPTANSEVKATCGVDKLEGKTILLEMRPPDSLFYDIRLPSLKEMYRLEKERHDFEIISIPVLHPTEVSSDVFDVYKQFSREVPWLVLRTTITREVQYFLAKHCTEWEEDNEDNECEKCYPSINWVIDPNGRITIYRPPISPGDMRDRGEVFKVFFNYLESQSYQLRWGVKAPLTTLGKIEEVRKNEWQQVKNMSALEFLFNHLESVSVKVKSLMHQGKFICFFAGSCYGEPWSMRSAMEQFRDSIHFINVSYIVSSFRLDYISKEYYYPLENTSEMEGTSLLNLSWHETVRFVMRLHHLKEEMKGMDQSDKQLCELKTILHSLLFKSGLYESFTFINELGTMVGALEGEKINSIFYPSDRRDKVQRFINSMLKEGGKEMHDEDSSLIRKMQTASALAVEQQNADVYFDALRDYISHLWGVQLYQLCKFNQEGKKRSPPRVTWPTWSRGLDRLKNLLSEGANEDWVKDVISRHSEEDEEDALDTVIKCLVQDIEEAEWAVAGLLAVADLLERFETVPPSSREKWLFVLEEMFRLAQYSMQFNQKAELWRRMKCGAIVVILRYSIICCWEIDRSKFAFSRWEDSSADDYDWLEEAEKDLREECDTLAQTMTEDLDNESNSLKKLRCYKWGFDLWSESEGEGEGGPSSEYKRSASCPDLCFPDLWLESEDEGGPSESEDEGGPSSEYKRSASFPDLWLNSFEE